MQLIDNIIKSTWWFNNFGTQTTLDGKRAADTNDMDNEAVRKLLEQNGYNPAVENIREREYPYLRDVTYLDHAGTTIYASSVIQKVSEDLLSNLYGNPHSQSPSSQSTTTRIRDVRLRVLRLFNANPEHFDVVFCANATAGIKLVLEAFAGQEDGFDFYYHKDCHTSVVGVRELAEIMRCLSTDEVNAWLYEEAHELLDDTLPQALFAYPAQSNFSGCRLPLHWARDVRDLKQKHYTLLDAAGMVTTSPIDLDAVAPDFTVVSFYKMFGYPDLGALIVRKISPGISEFLGKRQYFGGGTVAAVVAQGEIPFHAKRNGAPHEHLEDGTLPFHSIFALDAAIAVHEQLFGHFSNISNHTTALIKYMHKRLSALKHYNGRTICTIYSEPFIQLEDNSPLCEFSMQQGPIMTFNLRRADGSWVGHSEVEKLAALKNIHVRTGGLCNPGGVESYIGLKPVEVKQNYEAGHRCWDDKDIIRGKPTGGVRVSLGAMSTLDDALKFVAFIEEFYVEKERPMLNNLPVRGNWGGKASAVVETITIYPIKSCGGFKIPVGVTWELKPHGFAWDREWCLVHLGSGSAMNQKTYNKMALIRPIIDLEAGVLKVSFAGSSGFINISLSSSEQDSLQASKSRVCGDKITALTYNSQEVTDFFSEVIGVPCTLARFPASLTSQRHFKPHLASSHGSPANASLCNLKQPQILLSNESPILIINKTSVDYLNEQITAVGGKPAKADVFRANIVISMMGQNKSAYVEDTWKRIQIGKEHFELLGPCRRCHMVCIDQETAVKNEEPFITLAKTRTIGGRVLFGQHAMHLPVKDRTNIARVKVGDLVKVWTSSEENSIPNAKA